MGPDGPTYWIACPGRSAVSPSAYECTTTVFAPPLVTLLIYGLKTAGSTVPAAFIARAAIVTASKSDITYGLSLHCPGSGISGLLVSKASLKISQALPCGAAYGWTATKAFAKIAGPIDWDTASSHPGSRVTLVPMMGICACLLRSSEKKLAAVFPLTSVKMTSGFAWTTASTSAAYDGLPISNDWLTTILPPSCRNPFNSVGTFAWELASMPKTAAPRRYPCL